MAECVIVFKRIAARDPALIRDMAPVLGTRWGPLASVISLEVQTGCQQRQCPVTEWLLHQHSAVCCPCVHYTHHTQQCHRSLTNCICHGDNTTTIQLQYNYNGRNAPTPQRKYGVHAAGDPAECTAAFIITLLFVLKRCEDWKAPEPRITVDTALYNK